MQGEVLGQAHDDLKETWGNKGAVIKKYTQTLGEKGVDHLLNKRE